jgi:hypothetical protein
MIFLLGVATTWAGLLFTHWLGITREERREARRRRQHQTEVAAGFLRSLSQWQTVRFGSPCDADKEREAWGDVERAYCDVEVYSPSRVQEFAREVMDGTWQLREGHVDEDEYWAFMGPILHDLKEAVALWQGDEQQRRSVVAWLTRLRRWAAGWFTRVL